MAYAYGIILCRSLYVRIPDNDRVRDEKCAVDRFTITYLLQHKKKIVMQLYSCTHIIRDVIVVVRYQ